MSTNPPNPIPTLERDPVCGMNVNPATAKHIHDHAGKNFYFCCAPCLEKFKADPAKYLAPALRPSGLVTLAAAKPAQAENPSYVCPMCPEVRENKPGACPSCGMALEPDVPVSSVRTEYTCPMHPEIVRSAPGACPICGMALEPMDISAEVEADPEYESMSRRFWVSAAISAPLLALSMFGEALGLHWAPNIRNGIELLMATPVVLWGG